MPGSRPLAGQDSGSPASPRRSARPGPAAAVHGVEPAQEHAPHRRLDVVEAQVEADLGVHVLVEPAVIAQPPAPRGDLVVAVTRKPPSPMTVRFFDG